MPTIISSSTEQEMIATFLRGELGSSRFRVSLEEALAKLGLTTKVVECPNLDDDPENEARRELLVTYRGWGQEESLFGGLPVDSIEWFWVELTEDELRDRVFTIEYFWEEFSHGSRRPFSIAERIRRRDPEVGVDLYLAILEGVRRGQMPVEPIVVAEPTLERMVILEGHARITTYLVEPDLVRFPLRALIGVSAQMSRWSEW